MQKITIENYEQYVGKDVVVEILCYSGGVNYPDDNTLIGMDKDNYYFHSKDCGDWSYPVVDEGCDVDVYAKDTKKQYDKNTLGLLFCIEWLYTLLEPIGVAKGVKGTPAIDVNRQPTPFKDALNQIRKGIKMYKVAMRNKGKLEDVNYEAMQNFAADRMTLILETAVASMYFSDEELSVATDKMCRAVEDMRVNAAIELGLNNEN